MQISTEYGQASHLLAMQDGSRSVLVFRTVFDES